LFNFENITFSDFKTVMLKDEIIHVVSINNNNTAMNS